MPPNFRTNVDIAITLRENVTLNREKLYKMFFGVFETQKSFDMALTACTANYGGLVSANNLTISNEICDTVFWIRAPAVLPDVKLGRPEFWELDRRCYVDRELEETTIDIRGVVPCDATTQQDRR